MRRPLSLLVSVAALTVLFAAPSSAVSAGSRCPDDAYCLWTQKNFDGKKLVVRSGRLENLPSFMNDKASSMKNRRDTPVWVYEGRNKSGTSNCIGVGTTWPDIADVGAGELNNAISSTRPRDQICV